MAKAKTAYSPLILRCHRLMDAFSKSDDERDFYLEKHEGFIIFVDLDASDSELTALETELKNNADRYCSIPKLTFYETKKIMEGFTNEKVYDIDTKEKLLEVIGGKEPRENFLEFLHDNHVELDKWQLYYQERSRIRIIEWLRSHKLEFVFEEDLDIPGPMVEKLKSTLFQSKVSRDVATARKTVQTKAETYYSNEALNPRPKRGRPPKHVAKVETAPQYTDDFYQTIPSAARPFLFAPDISSLSSVTFSAKYDSEEELMASLRSSRKTGSSELDALSEKLASLRKLSAQLSGQRMGSPRPAKKAPASKAAPKQKSKKATTPAKKPAEKKPSLRRMRPAAKTGTAKKEPAKKEPTKKPAVRRLRRTKKT